MIRARNPLLCSDRCSHRRSDPGRRTCVSSLRSRNPPVRPSTAAWTGHSRSSDVVVDWSRIVFDAALVDDGFVSFLGTRHQVMVHVAMHDALNAIRPRFDQYAYFGRSRGAHPVAAAAAAAHDVLVAVYPAQQAAMDAGSAISARQGA